MDDGIGGIPASVNIELPTATLTLQSVVLLVRGLQTLIKAHEMGIEQIEEGTGVLPEEFTVESMQALIGEATQLLGLLETSDVYCTPRLQRSMQPEAAFEAQAGESTAKH